MNTTDMPVSGGPKPGAPRPAGARPTAAPSAGAKAPDKAASDAPAAGGKPRASISVKPAPGAHSAARPAARTQTSAPDAKPAAKPASDAKPAAKAAPDAKSAAKPASDAKPAAKAAPDAKSAAKPASDAKPAAKAAPDAKPAADQLAPNRHSLNIKVKPTPGASARRPAAAHSAAGARRAAQARPAGAHSAPAAQPGKRAPRPDGKPPVRRPGAQQARRPAGKQAARRPRTPAALRRKRRPAAPKWAAPLLIVCAVALVGLGCVSASAVSNYITYLNICASLEQDEFYDGVTLEGESLSGMTLFEAIDKYTRQQGDLASSTQITVNAMGKTYTLDSGSVQMSADIQATLNQAYSVGRSGSFEERYAQLQQLSASGMDFTLRRDWNESILRDKIEEIASDIYVQGKNATVDTFDPDTGEFTFLSEVTGYELDEEDLYSQITQAIANGNVTAQIEAKVDVIEPEYDVAYMEEHFGRIAMQRTNTTSNSNRNNNIKLATACFDGMRVEPGETVSFNDTTGERSPEKGYKDATAYSGGVTVQEPGGGVCQVSTTLYNAVVKAGLEIVERSPHSRPVNYIPIGLDAAVNYGTQDMQFKNNTDFPIFISAEYYDRTLTFKIYGHQMADGMYIMLEGEKTGTISAPSGVNERYDSSLPSGERKEEPARNGSRAVSYKVYYDADNNEIGREKLDDSTYPASKKIIRIGTG